MGSTSPAPIVGDHSTENVVLTEVDPLHQKTFPDFYVTSQRLGIALVDIASLEPIGNKLHYRDAGGRLTPIHRIYNRAIADELIARDIYLPFDLSHSWEVEWAGHPNWYFLISKFSIPWLAQVRADSRLCRLRCLSTTFLPGPAGTSLLPPVSPFLLSDGGNVLCGTASQAALLFCGKRNRV